jgi:nitrite reductase (NO-forming)
MKDDDPKTPEAPHVSRRSLLMGSAGLALGGTATAAAAASDPYRLAQVDEWQGEEGEITSRPKNPPRPDDLPDIARDPADVPPPIDRNEPATVRVDLETEEKEAKLADGASFRYWTFNGTVPGPMVRARVGDTVEVHIRNPEDSWMQHNVDFHAATGPGGGAEVTNVFPGEENSFAFKALEPGLYVYHCAVAPVAQHIANGMYGLILVEPEDGLPVVDREFYVMQGELYTAEQVGSQGPHSEDFDRLLDERATYVLFNGQVGALTDLYPLEANVGERVRLYFGVGGPNYMSSFHVIGEILEDVYLHGAIAQPPMKHVQSVPVVPGGAMVTDFSVQVPGTYLLVDHALSRLERGLVGHLRVRGEEKPEVFSENLV